MIRKASTHFLILVAAISCLYLASFFLAAEEEWNCGINGINLIILGAICAALASASVVAWRRLQPRDQGFGLRIILAPWLIFAAFAFFDGAGS